ncbi:hypothetical protein FRB90_005141 [Tulasnella sp. 427]|nr:hypothetical protein FRB90_005141 [Tulasnella sp. 427]
MASVSLTPIHTLPVELLLEIFRIVIPQWRRMKALVKLSSVCRRWRVTAEGAPTLWSGIDGDDGLPLVRKALELSKDVLLDITYRDLSGPSSIGHRIEFMEEIEGSTFRWRSLSVLGYNLNLAMVTLGGVSAPQLTALHLEQRFDRLEGQDHPIRWKVYLFGGPNALPQLKHFDVSGLPIAIAPLQLSGLKSLSMRDIRLASDEEIYQVLLNSPELELLELEWSDDSQWPTVAVEPPDSPFIELPNLTGFTLMRTHEEFGHRLLLSIVAPNLRHFEIEVNRGTHPVLNIISPNVRHWRRVLTSLTTGIQEIEMVGDAVECRIEVGGLTIWTHNHEEEPMMSNIEPVVDLVRSLGSHLHNAPINFTLSDEDHPVFPELLSGFSPGLGIAKLSLISTEEDGDMSDLVHLLSLPNASFSNGWIFPQLEILRTNLVWAEGNDDLLAVIKARSAAAAKQGEGSPKRLREIRLTMYDEDAPCPLNTSFKRALMEAADGAEVYWYGEKWGAEEGSSEQRS